MKSTSARLDCIARLALENITTARPAPIPSPPYFACKITDPVVLISVRSPENVGKIIVFPDRPLLSCTMAERLAKFSIETAQTLATSAYGSAITSLSTGPGYECRPRNRQAGAKVSSHGQGNAVDIAVMGLADGRTISIEKPDGAATVKFLASLRVAACAAFNTVLGPGADASHANHIHVDIEPRGKKGDSKFCQ